MPDDHSYTDDDADRIGDDRIRDDDRVGGDDYGGEYRGRTDATDDDAVGHQEYVENVYGDDDAVARDAEYGSDEYGNDDYDTGYAAADDDEGSWADEGLIGLLLVAGVVLFLFPEPATSAVGIALIALGVAAWAIDAAT